MYYSIVIDSIEFKWIPEKNCYYEFSNNWLFLEIYIYLSSLYIYLVQFLNITVRTDGTKISDDCLHFLPNNSLFFHTRRWLHKTLGVLVESDNNNTSVLPAAVHSQVHAPQVEHATVQKYKKINIFTLTLSTRSLFWFLLHQLNLRFFYFSLVFL